MGTLEPLHDPGPYDARLLGELLQAGVVVLDGRQRCCFANERACAQFGAADGVTLQNQWDEIRDKLELGDLAALGPGDPPLQRRLDVDTPAGMRKLRFELHAVGAAPRYLMLLRERIPIDGADRVQIMASELEANRHQIAGLVHDAKGPLNNLHLTLALLSAAMSRMESSGTADGMLARCRRYIDVLQTEEARLGGFLNDIHALSLRADAAPEQVDVGALVRAVARLLRHEARVREVSLEVDVPLPAWTFGDPHRLQLALLAFGACLLDAARPGTLIAYRVDDAGAGMPDIRIDIVGRDVTIPPAVTAAFFRISGVDGSDFPGVLAGRTIVEAQGGDVALVDNGPIAGFAITLPRGDQPN